ITAWVLIAAPKSMPLAGIPLIVPGSAVMVMRSMIRSSLATAAMPSGMPMPRLTTLLAFSSNAARRAMILRSLIGIGGSEPARTLISLEKAGLYWVPKVCQWFSGFATTTQSTRMPGILTWRGLRAAAFGHALDLRDHDAAGIMR